MKKPRDTWRYTLREGNRIVYYGVTNDPERRAAEHALDEREGHLRVEGPAVTRRTALDWEQQRIDAYRRRNGELPPLNER